MRLRWRYLRLRWRLSERSPGGPKYRAPYGANNVCLDPRVPIKVTIQRTKCRLHSSMAGNICPTMSGCCTPPALSSLSNTLQHSGPLATFTAQCIAVKRALQGIALHCIAGQSRDKLEAGATCHLHHLAANIDQSLRS